MVFLFLSKSIYHNMASQSTLTARFIDIITILHKKVGSFLSNKINGLRRSKYLFNCLFYLNIEIGVVALTLARRNQKWETSVKRFAKEMNVRPKLLASLINEVCETVINELDGLIAEHKKNYGEAKIYKKLNKIIKSNIIQLLCFFR